MFKDYDKAKKMLKGSFDHIIGLMDKRYVTYDEIKDLMVQALYELSKENEKVEVNRVSMPQVLYGPPPVMKEEREVVERVDMPQVLYGPPQFDRIEMDSMLNDDYIPGTNVRKPRPKNLGETDDEYLDYLDKYYGQYFNNGKDKGAGK